MDSKHMYDRRASNYDDSHHPSFARNFVEHVPLQPGDKVLDLACGTGLISFLAADKVGPTGAVVGVDISSGMLQVAQKKLSSHAGANVTFHEHDITRLDDIPSLAVQKGTFSAITIASALVLLHDPADALASWLPYLRPGGYLVTDVPHPQNWLHMSLIELVSRHMKLHFPYHRIWASEENSLRTLLTKAGLEVTSYTFVECVGYHEKIYALEDADEWFAKAVSSIPEVSRLFEDEALYAEAQRLYRGEWAKVAAKDPLGHGRAIDVDGVYVAAARASDQSCLPERPAPSTKDKAKAAAPTSPPATENTEEDGDDEEEEAPLTPTPTPSSPLTLPGSCHCGALRFQLNVTAAPVAIPTSQTLSSISATSPAVPAVPLSALTCHCRTCRRISASTSQTYVPVHMSSFHWLSSLNKSYPATPHNGPPALRPRTFDEHAERAFCAVCGAGVYLWWFEDEDDELEAGEMPAGRANATAKAKARAKGKARECAQTAEDAEAGSRGHRLWVAAGAIADAAEPDAVTSSVPGGVVGDAAKVRVNITVRHHIWLGEKAAWDVLPADGAERWVGDAGGEAWKGDCDA